MILSYITFIACDSTPVIVYVLSFAFRERILRYPCTYTFIMLLTTTWYQYIICTLNCIALIDKITSLPYTGRPGSSKVPRNPMTRWDVSSIPANGIFLTKKLKNKIKMPNGWRTIQSLHTLVHKIRLHSRRGKGMAESFSREKLRHAPQKEGG